MHSLSSFIVTRVSQDSYFSALYHKCSAVPGELLSKFTLSGKPYIWRCLSDANVKQGHNKE